MNQQSGVAMIESLVSIVVLSVGLLAMAGLLAFSMRAMGTAQYQSQAVYAAQMIGAAAFSEAAISVTALTALDGASTASAPSSGTTALNQALIEWSRYTQANLPGGVGTLAVTAPAGGTCTALPCQLGVTMRWTGAAQMQQTYVVSMILGY